MAVCNVVETKKIDACLHQMCFDFHGRSFHTVTHFSEASAEISELDEHNGQATKQKVRGWFTGYTFILKSANNNTAKTYKIVE